MKLWKYLKQKMQTFEDRIAIANLNLTYKDLLELESLNNKKIKICEGIDRAHQALEIIKTIATGGVVVPISKEYGRKNYDYIIELIKNSNEDFSDLAFIVFTSGTTGDPKGVMLTEDNIISNLEYISTYFNVRNINSICIARPLVHISVLTGELLYALCNGLTIYFYEESFVPRRLISFLVDNNIDAFCGTPTLFTSLAQADKEKKFPIKIGVISGEILSEKAKEIIANTFSKTKFYHVYGMTEHSPRVTALLPEEFMNKPNSVGRAIGNIKLKLINNQLLIKSDSVMRGYFNEPIKTKSKIIDGWLYTGDMAYIDEDGYVYIKGRIDNMIIKAGINIYPEEIEVVVNDINGVSDCLVFAIKENEQTIICLKYVGDISPLQVRKELINILNPNIIPNRIEKVNFLEKTVSGKRVRK